MRQKVPGCATYGCQHITQSLRAVNSQSLTYTLTGFIFLNSQARYKRKQKTLFACIRRTELHNPLSSKDALADRIYLRTYGHKTQTRPHQPRPDGNQTKRPRTLTDSTHIEMISNMADQRGQADMQTW